MIKKKAVLVTFAPMTRVIIIPTGDEDQDFAQAVRLAREKMENNLADYLCSENAEVKDDEEMPYGTDNDDIYYQPEVDELGNILGHPGESCFSFEVWSTKEALLEAYPNCTPIEYSGDDIEDKNFVE